MLVLGGADLQHARVALRAAATPLHQPHLALSNAFLRPF
eukprot:COSAG02_NODE_48960_length_329_cov_0.792208_1_plen_38_part_10